MPQLRLRIFTAVVVSVPALCAPNLPSSWSGTCSYEGIVDHPWIPIAYSLDITISPDSKCVIDFEGYQTEAHISCLAVRHGTSVALTYVSDVNTSEGSHPYWPGEVLLTLTEGTDTTSLKTEWGKIHPPSAVNRRGDYIERVR